MADTKISGLTAKTTLADADMLVLVDEAATPDETKKITVANARKTTGLVTATYVNAAGAVMESDGLSVSNDGTKTTVKGTTGDYNRIGEGGTTAHTLDSENDLMVTGELEVKGATFIDGAVTVASTVDGVDIAGHDSNTTTAHGAVSAATASKIVVRDASGRAAFAAPSAAGDAAILSTVTDHTGDADAHGEPTITTD